MFTIVCYWYYYRLFQPWVLVKYLHVSLYLNPKSISKSSRDSKLCLEHKDSDIMAHLLQKKIISYDTVKIISLVTLVMYVSSDEIYAAKSVYN